MSVLFAARGSCPLRDFDADLPYQYSLLAEICIQFRCGIVQSTSTNDCQAFR
jgi:hypothetical protein